MPRIRCFDFGSAKRRVAMITGCIAVSLCGASCVTRTAERSDVNSKHAECDGGAESTWGVINVRVAEENEMPVSVVINIRIIDHSRDTDDIYGRLMGISWSLARDSGVITVDRAVNLRFPREQVESRIRDVDRGINIVQQLSPPGLNRVSDSEWDIHIPLQDREAIHRLSSGGRVVLDPSVSEAGGNLFRGIAFEW